MTLCPEGSRAPRLTLSQLCWVPQLLTGGRGSKAPVPAPFPRNQKELGQQQAASASTVHILSSLAKFPGQPFLLLGAHTSLIATTLPGLSPHFVSATLTDSWHVVKLCSEQCRNECSLLQTLYHSTLASTLSFLPAFFLKESFFPIALISCKNHSQKAKVTKPTSLACRWEHGRNTWKAPSRQPELV